MGGRTRQRAQAGEGGRSEMRRTEIEMAGGKQRQVVCGSVCVNESAGVKSVQEASDERQDRTETVTV